MAEGRSNTAIARLGISSSAVEKHVEQVFIKLDLPSGGRDHRRVLAVLAYLGELSPFWHVLRATVQSPP